MENYKTVKLGICEYYNLNIHGFDTNTNKIRIFYYISLDEFLMWYLVESSEITNIKGNSYFIY